MIKIAITVEAFEAFASTLPFGSVGYEPELNAKGECFVWLAPKQGNRWTTSRWRGGYTERGRNERAAVGGPFLLCRE
jgi:hypothetical protein